MFSILFEWFWNTLDYLGNFYFVTATHFGIILSTLDSVKKFDYNKQIHSFHEHLSWFTVPFIKLKRKARLVFLGLDGAGKTTLMGRLKYDRLIQAVPTGQPSELSTTIFFFKTYQFKLEMYFGITLAWYHFKYRKRDLDMWVNWNENNRRYWMIFSVQEEMTLGSTTFIAHDLGGHRQGTLQLPLVAPSFKSATYLFTEVPVR